MSILSKAIYSFNAIPIKIPTAFFTEIKRTILKFVRKYKRPQIAKANLKKRAKKEASQFLASNYTTKLYQSKQYSIGIKTDTVQWNRIKSQEITPHTYGQLIYGKEAKNIQWRKKSLFFKWCWEHRHTTFKRMKLGPLSYTICKN